jgi:hypothetical protein
VKPLAIGAFVAIAAAACTTIAFVAVLQPISAAAFLFFSAWLLSPHAVMAGALWLRERKGAAPAYWHAIAIFVALGGVLYLADPIFWHIDPQSAIAVVMAPLLQFIALAILLPVAALVARLARRS